MKPSSSSDDKLLRNRSLASLNLQEAQAQAQQPSQQPAQQQQQQQQQQTVAPLRRTQWLHRFSQLPSRTSNNMHNQAIDPTQSQAEPLIPSEAPFQNNDLHHNKHQQQVQVNTKKPARHLTRLISQTDPQLQPELQPKPQVLQFEKPEEPEPCDDEGDIADSKFERLLRELRSQYSTENIPPSQLVPKFDDPPTHFQRSELVAANTEDMEVDEIQPNAPPEHPKQEKAKRPKTMQSHDKNPAKGLHIAKTISKHSNQPQKVRSNIGRSNAFKITRSEPQVKCISCNSKFPGWHAMRRHFRMVHASESMSSICHECFLTYTRKWGLQKHWKTAHEGELNFVCDACGARFSKKLNLTLHRKQLHSDKPMPEWKITKIHKCQLCDFTSNEKLAVVTHLFGAHADAANIDCPGGCGRSFQSMADAKAHYFNCTDSSKVDT